MYHNIKKTIYFLSATFVITFTFCSDCFAGAWTLEKGAMYNKLAANYFYADEEFDESGSRNDFEANGDFEDRNLNYYTEYGLIDKLTLITSLYYKYLKKEDDTVEMKTYGIGDIDLGIKYKLIEGSNGVLSAQGLIKVPEAYDENDSVPLGNGQYDTELRLLYGRSLWPYIPGYCNFEIGYRWRAEEPADEFRYLVEFGMDFSQKAYGRVKLDGILGMDNGNEIEYGEGNPSATYDFDLGKLDIAFGYKVAPKWCVEIGYMPTIYGESTAAGATYSVALIFQIH